MKKKFLKRTIKRLADELGDMERDNMDLRDKLLDYIERLKVADGRLSTLVKETCAVDDRLREFIEVGRKLAYISSNQKTEIDGVVFNGHQFDALWRLVRDDHGKERYEPFIDGPSKDDYFGAPQGEEII